MGRRISGTAARHKRGTVALGILAAGIVLLTGLVATAPDVAREARPERVWAVDVVTAEMRDHRPLTRFAGTVVPSRSLELRPMVGGTVAEMSANLVNGGVVRAGDTLLTLDPVDHELHLKRATASLEEAKARLRELEAGVEAHRIRLDIARRQLDLRNAELARNNELFKNGTIAAPRLEQAKLAQAAEEQAVAQQTSAYAAQQAQVSQQEAAIARLSAELEQARINLERTRIKAPFDAFVGQVRAETGMLLSPSDQVAKLVAAERLEVFITVPTEFYGRLVQAGEPAVGRQATVVWRMGASELSYAARIERIAEAIDTASGGVGLHLTVPGNFLDQSLRPGAFVDVMIEDRTFPSVVALPGVALHGEDTVYVVSAEDRLEARTVDLASRQNGLVFVSSGLSSGDRVVTTRFPEIAPGLKVAPRGNATGEQTADLTGGNAR